jgi:hypothetical protein
MDKLYENLNTRIRYQQLALLLILIPAIAVENIT